MSGKIIALYHDPWSDIAAAPATLRRPLLLWRKAMWFKANPRSAAYMKARLAEHRPDAVFVDTAAEPDWPGRLAGAERIILLYPDAIGIGFGAIERAVLRLAPRGTVEILNGRRRVFPLDRAARARLLLRRVLERSMIVECAIGAAMLIATPVLLCVDFAKGRR